MPSAADDRRWIIEQWRYLFNNLPSAEMLEEQVASLQSGKVSRTQWMASFERLGAGNTVRRFYREILGREADLSDPRVNAWVRALENGTLTRAQLRERLAGSTEALLRQPQETPDLTQEDSLVYLKTVLDGYGLGALGDWAWDQIKQGFSPDRIIQNLRETDAYKQRFKGLEQRRLAGLPAISEAEYIAYESDVRQMMRAAGMPADFYDNPDDFANFIGKDVSVAEMQARISEGYLAASQAPAEVREQLRTLYGVDEGQLAAFFLDPDRALPIIQRQFTAAQVSGAASRTGYGGLNAAEAENLAVLGITEREAEQGFGVLVESRELFGTLPGMAEQEITRETQQAAVFGGDANARSAIERRAAERRSAASGAQSFAIGSGGIAGLSER